MKSSENSSRLALPRLVSGSSSSSPGSPARVQSLIKTGNPQRSIISRATLFAAGASAGRAGASFFSFASSSSCFIILVSLCVPSHHYPLLLLLLHFSLVLLFSPFSNGDNFLLR